MPDAETVNKARSRLDDAVADYIRDTSETSGVVIDWHLMAEVHTEENGRSIQVAESPTMTPWKREGLVRFLARAFGVGS